MTPAQCRTARGLIGMSQRVFARAAVVPRGVIVDFEFNALPPKPAYLEAMRRVLERAGVEFTDVGGQSGVRLRK
jgi:hypothetical protein